MRWPQFPILIALSVLVALPRVFALGVPVALMAKKSSAAKAAAPVGAKKAKTPVGVKKASKPPGPELFSSPASASVSPRKLWRRSSDEQVGRCLKLKLGHFPKVQVEQNVDDDGCTAAQNVKRELSRLKNGKKHLALAFWSGLIKKLKLTGSVAQTIPDPSAEEPVRRELDQALRLCHHANPATRSCARVQRFLQYADSLNETEFCGLLKASYQAPSLSRVMSVQMLEAAMCFCARTRSDLTFPAHFEAVKDSFDQVLTVMYQKSRSDNMSRSHFMRAQRGCLALFVDMDVATKVDIAVSADEAPACKDIEILIKSSEIGAQLFASEAMALESTAFEEDITRRLDELEMCDFDAQEVTSFGRILMCTAENFDQDTWDSFDGKKGVMAFCGGEIGYTAVNPNDIWQHRLSARVVTLAISTCQVKRLPHEAWLFGTQMPIEGCATTIVVPESLIYKAKNVRDHLMGIIEASPFMTAARLKELFVKHHETLHKSCNSWWLEEEFLLGGEYDKRIDAHLKTAFVAIFPKLGEEADLPRGVIAMKKLAHGEVALAQDIVLQKELVNAANMMAEVMEAKAPTATEAAKLSQFAQRVLKSAENYFKVEIDESFVPTDTPQGTMLFGGVALKELLSKMKLKKAGQHPGDLKTLRIFRWMLDGNENLLFEEWTRDSVHNERDRMKMMKAKALKDMEEEPDAKRPAVRKEVTAPPLIDKTASVRASSSKGPKAAAHTEERADEELETPSGLMSFFGAKAL